MAWQINPRLSGRTGGAVSPRPQGVAKDWRRRTVPARPHSSAHPLTFSGVASRLSILPWTQEEENGSWDGFPSRPTDFIHPPTYWTRTPMAPASQSNPYTRIGGEGEEGTSSPSDAFPAPRPTYRITGRQAKPSVTSPTVSHHSVKGDGTQEDQWSQTPPTVPTGLSNSPVRARPSSASSSTAALPPRDSPYSRPRSPGLGKGDRHRKNASYSSASATLEGHGDTTLPGTMDDGIQLRKMNHGSERRDDPSRHALPAGLSDAWPLERISAAEEDDTILLAEHTGAHNTAQGGSRLSRHPLSSPTTPRFRLGGINEDRYEMGMGLDEDRGMGYDREGDDEEDMAAEDVSGAFDLQKLGSGHMDDIAVYIRDERIRWVYLLIEDPSSSKMAFYVSVFVAISILFGAFITVIETIPFLRSDELNIGWSAIDTAIILIYTIELALRIFAHSDRLEHFVNFALSPLTLIDLAVVLVYYINWGLGHEP
ncbi:hypothetical protein BJ684DRAFT_18004, partial [Piptocephalis cylindrospora]